MSYVSFVVRFLQMIENAVTRLVCSQPKKDAKHATPLLVTLCWLPLVGRIEGQSLYGLKPTHVPVA